MILDSNRYGVTPNPTTVKQKFYKKKRDSLRDIKNFVPGCEHPVWIAYTVKGSGVTFDISCDGSDSQGVAGIVVQALGGLTAREIRAIDFPSWSICAIFSA